MIFEKKAMTLTEIIIVVLLRSIVIGAGITPFILQQSMLKSQMARSNIQDQVSIAIAYIDKDIFRAESAVLGGTASSITIGIGTDLTPGADQDIVYGLSGTDLQRDGVTIAKNITAITFDVRFDNLVQVTITASDGSQNLTSSTEMALRATQA